jgi:hypothetical protein
MEFKANRQAKAAAKAAEDREKENANNANAMCIEDNNFKIIGGSQTLEKDPANPFAQTNFRLFLDENSYNS